MNTRKDISSIEDIKLLVNTFYGKVRKDAVIGPIFIGAIQDHWEPHLEKMYRFWQTILLAEHTYMGSPFMPHARMPLEQKHFNAWLRLWHETVDEHFTGKLADEAKWRASKMADLFISKINYIRENKSIRPIL